MVEIKRPQNLEIDKQSIGISASSKDAIGEADLLKGIYPLDISLKVLTERVNNLESSIRFEMCQRDEIMEATKKDTQWKITLFVTIVLAILTLIFK